MDADKLLLVDYGFHLPYILAAGVVVHFFLKVMRAQVEAAPVARRRAEGRAVRAA